MLDYLGKAPADFEPVDLDDLPGFSTDRLAEAWGAFQKSCARIIKEQPVLRSGSSAPPGAQVAAEIALRHARPSETEIRTYFLNNFSGFRIRPRPGLNPYAHGFVTGYYEPEVAASYTRTPIFNQPVLGRPGDLDNEQIVVGSTIYSSSRVRKDGVRAPYWSRAEIDAGNSAAPILLWVRDAIELFMMQVQGSARVLFQDGRTMRLVYAGRNGHPYESIGRILVSEGHILLAEMSLERLKNWVRKSGQTPGDAGLALLHRNPSYVFFNLAEDIDPSQGPVGGEGIPLTKLRSLAIDRSIWSYGLPFWVSGSLPAESGETSKFQQLLIAQDTGSAIIGAARGDIFYGSGESAGRTAATVRHEVEMFVLIPKG